MLEQIKQALAEKGHKVAVRPCELNIVGLRVNNHTPNTFDDHICVFYTDFKGNCQHHLFPATTDPGTYWLRHPENPQGTAILKPGQYKGSHALGMHHGKYLALVQVRPVTVIRDYNRDGKADYNSGRQESGIFGINIHRAFQDGVTKYVDKYSAGCQVFADARNFLDFLLLCKKHKELYGNSFTYTLLDGISEAQAVAMAA